MTNKNMDKKYSMVNIRGGNQQKKIVEITSEHKPKLLTNILNKWQSLIDLATKVANVPSGLIMKLNEDTIEVYLKSQTNGNPYEKGEQARLIYGLYCETVIGTQSKLLVPDATKSNIWKDNNPDIDLNMISYLGFPINWPDGEVFGTVCLLDEKENSYNEIIIDLLFNLKQHIETDLNFLVIQQELEDTNKQLNETNATKDKFFSIISHDLKNPFNSLLGFSNRLNMKFDDYDTSKQKKMVNIIDETVKRTYKLFETLLTWSRSQRGKIEYRPQKNNLHLLTNETIELLSQSAESKQITVINNISKTIYVNVDENMIQTVIRNLISNAIKFTPKNGKIDIFTELFKENDQNYIKLVVVDNGVGLNEENKLKLFKLSENITTTGTEKEKGTGLGLIICKEFVEKHGGKIWVESKSGEGSSFIFTIPTEDKFIENDTIQDDIIPVILIAEDDEVNYMYLETILEDYREEYNFPVKLIHAYNGVEAVDICKTNKVDLILMDIGMPEMNGHEATKMIKSINKDIPIIAQTAFVEDKDYCLSNGYDDFLDKPINEKVLIESVKKYLT